MIGRAAVKAAELENATAQRQQARGSVDATEPEAMPIDMDDGHRSIAGEAFTRTEVDVFHRLLDNTPVDNSVEALVDIQNSMHNKRLRIQ